MTHTLRFVERRDLPELVELCREHARYERSPWPEYERVERLEEDKRGVADDIKEVYAEAKGEGFDVKVLRKVVALRRKDPEERAEEDELVELYMSALGE